MEVVVKELDSRQALLTAEVEEEWLDPFLRTASRRLANRVAIPGFRKGKAPHRVVLRHMGKEALIREVIDELGEAAYDEAVEKSRLEPIQLDDLEIAEWEPLTLAMTVSLKPTIDLGDYRSLPVAIREVEVEDVEIEDVLRGLQEQYAERVSVDRPAALGDFALVDVEGTLDGREVVKLDQQEYQLRSDADSPVANFGEKLIGMSVGEERSFRVAFPGDYEDETFAGHEVDFRAHLYNLQEKHLPEMNDDLARMVGGFASLEELRRKIADDLYSRRDAEQKDELVEGLLDSIAEEGEIDYPPLFLNRELEAMVRMLVLDLQEQGFTLQGYLRATDRTIEDLVDEFRPTAAKRVRRSLVLAQLVEEEAIEVEDREVEDELVRLTEVYGQDTKAVREALSSNDQVREDLRNRLYGRKLVERLSELTVKTAEEDVVKIEEPSLAGEEDRVSLEEDFSDSS